MPDSLLKANKSLLNRFCSICRANGNEFNQFQESLLLLFLEEFPKVKEYYNIGGQNITLGEIIHNMYSVLDLVEKDTNIENLLKCLTIISNASESTWYHENVHKLEHVNINELVHFRSKLHDMLHVLIERKKDLNHDFYELYRALLKDCQGQVLARIDELTTKVQRCPKRLQSWLYFNIKTGHITFKNILEPPKPWFDLKETNDYFVDNQIADWLNNIDEMSYLDNKEEAKQSLQYLLPRNQYPQLVMAINDYHNIKKGDPKNGSQRQKKLLEIRKLAGELLEQNPNPLLEEIHSQSKLKRIT